MTALICSTTSLRLLSLVLAVQLMMRHREIRNEKITREEGVNLVRKYDQEFPQKYFKEFLEYIGITEELFNQTVNKFRSHIFGIKRVVSGSCVMQYGTMVNKLNPTKIFASSLVSTSKGST